MSLKKNKRSEIVLMIGHIDDFAKSNGGWNGLFFLAYLRYDTRGASCADIKKAQEDYEFGRFCFLEGDSISDDFIPSPVKELVNELLINEALCASGGDCRGEKPKYYHPLVRIIYA